MPLKIGVVGAGKFGTLHGLKYHARSECVISGVFDPDRDAAKALGTKLKSRMFEAYSDLCQNSDAIVVATPASDHANMALQALQQGCHVFIEKPIALRLDEADALIDMAEQNSLILQIGHQERYLVEALGLFSLSKAPKMIKCCRCMPATGRGEDVSAIMDLMIHDLDILMCFARHDRPMITVDAHTQNNADQAHINFEFPNNGIMASCTVSRRSERAERSLALHYDEGIIHVDFLTKTIKNETSLSLQSDFITSTDLAISDPLAYGAQNFIHAITDGYPPIIDGRAGRRALALASKIEKLIGTIHNQSVSSLKDSQCIEQMVWVE